MGVFELPYLFKDSKQSDNIIDNHLFKPTEELLRKNGFQLYIFSENGNRNFATTARFSRFRGIKPSNWPLKESPRPKSNMGPIR